MATFRCARFPQGTARINTSRGLVEFRDGLAGVDDDQLAEALREVPDVFGVYEIDDPVPEGHKEKSPQRPLKSANKDDWVAYAVAALAITEQQAKSMTKDQLMELAR